MNEQQLELYLGFTTTYYNILYNVGKIKKYPISKDVFLGLLYNKYRHRKYDYAIVESVRKNKKLHRLRVQFYKLTMRKQRAKNKISYIIEENIRNAMKTHGYDYTKLSKRMRYDYVRLKLAIEGNMAITAVDIFELSKIFNIPVEWFFVDHTIESIQSNSDL